MNESITFDGSGSTDPDGTIQQYAWTFGDGSSSTQQVTTHAFAQPGFYAVNLTVTDNEGASSRSSIRIDVPAEPTRLAALPPSGSLRPGESRVITVSYDAAGRAPGSYTGEVSLTTNGGNFTIPVTIRVSPSTGTETEVPTSFSLEQNYPNPFNPETTIRFTLAKTGLVRLTIFDVNGRVVRILVDGTRPEGSHQVPWDGRDSAGRLVASGTYLYRLETGAGKTPFRLTRKMTLLR